MINYVFPDFRGFIACLNQRFPQKSSPSLGKDLFFILYLSSDYNVLHLHPKVIPTPQNGYYLLLKNYLLAKLSILDPF
jgi:hypothetical protein